MAEDETTAMMTVGSVRGKERFEMPLRVAQEGREVDGVARVVLPMEEAEEEEEEEEEEEVREAISVGGQVRFMPALMERVG